MTNKDYLQDISEIKQLMNKSSKFLSLSGLSGVFAGIYALIGAYLAHILIQDRLVIARPYTNEQASLLIQLLLLAFAIMVLSVLTALYFSYNKARKNNEKMWDVGSKNLLMSFLLPLITGGIFALILIIRQYYGLLSGVTLIFYGLALINASKYTYGTIYYLGISEVLIGLTAVAVPGYGIYFWAIGFGIFHIIYGLIMYYKFDRKI
jgi:hypothetical protein